MQDCGFQIEDASGFKRSKSIRKNQFQDSKQHPRRGKPRTLKPGGVHPRRTDSDGFKPVSSTRVILTFCVPFATRCGQVTTPIMAFGRYRIARPKSASTDFRRLRFTRRLPINVRVSSTVGKSTDEARFTVVSPTVSTTRSQTQPTPVEPGDPFDGKRQLSPATEVNDCDQSQGLPQRLAAAIRDDFCSFRAARRQ